MRQLDQLTSLRFIAAIAVVIFHFGHGVSWLQWGEPLWAVANSAVSFFFVLSGFVLTYVYASRGLERVGKFYAARIARIVPLYLVALLAMMAMQAKNGELRADSAVFSLALVQAWIPSYSQVINVPGWSLSAEMFFYLMFPLVLQSIMQIRSTRSLLSTATVIYLANLLLHVLLFERTAGPVHDHALHDFAFYHPLTHLATFSAGCIGGLLFLRHRAIFARISSYAIGGAAAGLVLLVWIPNPIIAYHHNGLLTPLFVLLLAGMSAAGPTRLTRALSWRPLVFLGEVSYGIYILQMPVHHAFHAVLAQVPVQLSTDAQFGLFTALLLAVSAAGYRFIEMPYRTKLKRWLTPPATRETGSPAAGELARYRELARN